MESSGPKLPDGSFFKRSAVTPVKRHNGIPEQRLAYCAAPPDPHNKSTMRYSISLQLQLATPGLDSGLRALERVLGQKPSLACAQVVFAFCQRRIRLPGVHAKSSAREPAASRFPQFSTYLLNFVCAHGAEERPLRMAQPGERYRPSDWHAASIV
jgi:hypothetical protein